MGDDSDAVVREQTVATNMIRMNVGVDEKFDVFVCQSDNFFEQLRHRRLEMGIHQQHTVFAHHDSHIAIGVSWLKHVQLALNRVRRKRPLLCKRQVATQRGAQQGHSH